MKRITRTYQLPNKCLFFGYGSLMYYNGINGRGLKHKYKSNNELIPTMAKGLKRSMSAEVNLLFRAAVRFYSIDKNPKSKVFGMLFKIHSLFDLVALLKNEGARPIRKDGVYHLYDISDCINNNTELKVFSLLCKEKQDKPSIYYPDYVKTVFNNIPTKYKKAFLDTGGVYPPDVDAKCKYSF